MFSHTIKTPDFDKKSGVFLASGQSMSCFMGPEEWLDQNKKGGVAASADNIPEIMAQRERISKILRRSGQAIG
jgi:hypothetical protein